MGILNTFTKKKTLILTSLIYSGIYTLLFLYAKLSSGSTVGYDMSMGTASAMLGFFGLFFYASLVVSILLGAFSIKYFMDDKTDFIILGEGICYIISAILLIFVLPLANFCFDILMGDHTALYSADFNSLVAAGNYLNYQLYLMVFVFIATLIIFLIANNTIKTQGFAYSLDDNVSFGNNMAGGAGTVTGYDPETGQPIYASQSAQTPTGYDPQTGQPIYGSASAGTYPQKPSFDFGAFIKSRNGMIIIGVVAAIVVGFGGYKIYDTYFNKTKISLLGNIEVEFAGYDGYGYISNCDMGDIEYDHTNSELQNFIYNIYIDYDVDNYTLSNGDEVTFTAVYDQDMAKQLKLDVQDVEVTVTVDGLIERYETADDVPSSIASEIKQMMDEEVQDDYDNDSYYSWTYTSSFKSMLYAYDTEDVDDTCIGIYEITRTDSLNSVTVYYIICYVSPVNEEFDEDDAYAITSVLYNDSYDQVTTLSEAEECVQDISRYEDHEFSEF